MARQGQGGGEAESQVRTTGVKGKYWGCFLLISVGLKGEGEWCSLPRVLLYCSRVLLYCSRALIEVVLVIC